LRDAEKDTSKKGRRGKYLAIPVTLMFVLVALVPIANANIGGLDNYGHMWKDTKNPAPTTTYSWIDITTSGTATGVTGDDSQGNINIGFTFNFYGNEYTQVSVCSNGFLQFAGLSTEFFNSQIPTTGGLDPDNIICPFWDDIDPSVGGTIFYDTQGTAPDRMFIVEWSAVPRYFDTGSSLTFEVILYETSNYIKFQYNTMTSGTAGTFADGSSATIGIEDSTAGDGLQYSFDTAGTVTNGMAVLVKNPDHDLKVEALIAPGWGSTGEPISINSIIKNNGINTETGINVSLKINGTPVDWTGPIYDITSSTTIYANFTHVFPAWDLYNVTINVSTVQDVPIDGRQDMGRRHPLGRDPRLFGSKWILPLGGEHDRSRLCCDRIRWDPGPHR